MSQLISDSNTKARLITAAIAARENSYAPYSHYRVGAALLLQNGDVVTGCNVENVSYGLCICAERAAVATAVGMGEQQFKAIAVVTASTPPGSPCGMCRQVLAEFAQDMPIILANDKGDVIETTLKTIFPGSFTKSDLNSGVDKG